MGRARTVGRGSPGVVATGLLAFMVMGMLPRDARAQSELPLVERTPDVHLRANVRWVLKSLAQLEAPLPRTTVQAVEKLLAEEASAVETLTALQKQLDPFCLVGVTINPESRVKAARGPAAALLRAGDRRLYLIKVQNDAGVTQPLTLTSPNLAAKELADAERWLLANLWSDASQGKPRPLTGHELEYALLVCQATSPGKREAKLIFDVGQGTQDLGFRAETPILFTIQKN